MYCNKFENSQEVIFSKLVRVLDRQIFRLVRLVRIKSHTKKYELTHFARYPLVLVL